MKNFLVFSEQMVSFKDKRGAVKPNIYLLGSNMSGKTSFLKVFSFMRELTDALLYNEVLKKRTKTRFPQEYNELKMAEFVESHRRKNSEGNLQIIYELYINKDYYTYELVFNEMNKLQSEILLKRGKNKEILIFSFIDKKFEIGFGMIPVEFHPVMEDLVKSFGDDYTFLSIIYYAQLKKLIEVKFTLQYFLDYISTVLISHDNYKNQRRIEFLYDQQYSPFQGYFYDEMTTNYVELIVSIYSRLVVSLFPMMNHLSYSYSKKDNLFFYELKAYIKTEKGPLQVEIQSLPKSVRKVISLGFAIIGLKTANIPLILDDMSDHLHTDLLEKILKEFYAVNSQVMMSLTHLDIINTLDPKFIYIVNYNVSGSSIICIEDIHPTRFSQDVRSRYESGWYSDTPNTVKLILDPYVEQIKDLLNEYSPFYK